MSETETLPDDQLAAADALWHIARDEELKQFVMETDRLYTPLRRAADRFIGGETFEKCIETAREITSNGHTITLDYIGEGPRNEQEANEAAEEIQRIVTTLEGNHVSGSISVDLSQIGLAVGRGLAVENIRQIAAAACEIGAEVMINMEGSEYTDDTLAVHDRLCETFDNVGLTLQAYLYRTDETYRRSSPALGASDS